jgi:hypothetical protein
VVGHLTCLMLFKHRRATELLVSDDNDAVGAVWIPKALMSIASPDRGRFLVVTLSGNLARTKGLVDAGDRRDPPSRRAKLALLNDAIAKRLD